MCMRGRGERGAMEGLWAKGKREMKPLLLRVGVAFALSFAGYLYSQLRSRHPRPRSAPSPSGAEAEGKGRRAGCGGLKDELRLMKHDDVTPKIINSAIATVVVLSPSSKDSGDEEGYLLPEFNELVLKEFESSGSGQDTPTTPNPKKSESENGTATEQEIANLRNLVRLLRERERNLEMQLLEYYGLKEQESSVRELENRLKINTMEAKFFTLKIESLQADNRRLEAHVSDYSRIKAELESTKAKIKLLKRKLRSESEQAKEKVAALQQRVAALEDRECADGADSEDVERSLRRLKDLEDDAADLRRVNSRLALENMDLEKKLESTQNLASCVLEAPEAAKALEEANRLRQTNDQLTKEIEQLQMDRCADVEELVYLRWVNACLRYELRNYQPPPGKTIARDLSKSLSLKSEEKAKQLILEYANSGIDEKNISLMDFNSECCSSSQTSSLTETGEDDISADVSTSKNTSSSKTKFLSKLKRLVLGKDIQSNRVSSFDNSERRASISVCSFDDVMERDSYDSTSSCVTIDHAPVNQVMRVEAKADEQHQNKTSWTRNMSRYSLDLQRIGSQIPEEVGGAKGEHSTSDVGISYGQKNMVFGEESLVSSSHTGQLDYQNVDSPEKMELKKFADVLKSSRAILKFHQRSASFNL